MSGSRWRRGASALLLVTSLGLAACGGGGGDEDPTEAESESGAVGQGDDNETAAATVDLKPTTFEPADVTIKAGESVTWKWGGGVQHDVEGEGFKSKLQSRGEFDHTFAEAGTYEYKCNVHPATMKGTVTVQ